MQHRNAPLTPNGGRRLAKSTAHTWVSRWREAGRMPAATSAASPTAHRAPSAAPPRRPRRRRGRSASAVSRRAGARAAWPMSPTSQGPTRPCIASCAAAVARGAPYPSTG